MCGAIPTYSSLGMVPPVQFSWPRRKVCSQVTSQSCTLSLDSSPPYRFRAETCFEGNTPGHPKRSPWASRQVMFFHQVVSYPLTAGLLSSKQVFVRGNDNQGQTNGHVDFSACVLGHRRQLIGCKPEGRSIYRGSTQFIGRELPWKNFAGYDVWETSSKIGNNPVQKCVQHDNLSANQSFTTCSISRSFASDTPRNGRAGIVTRRLVETIVISKPSW